MRNRELSLCVQWRATPPTPTTISAHNWQMQLQFAASAIEELSVGGM